MSAVTAWRILVVNGDDQFTTSEQVADAMREVGEHVTPLIPADTASRLRDVEQSATRFLIDMVGPGWRDLLQARFETPAVALARALAAVSGGDETGGAS